MEGLVKKLIGT